MHFVVRIKQGWGIVSQYHGLLVAFPWDYLFTSFRMFLLYSQPSKKVQWMELLFPFVILLTATLMNSYLSLSLSNSLLSVALPSFWMIHIDWLAIPWWKKSRGIKCTKREDPTHGKMFFLEEYFPVFITPLFLAAVITTLILFSTLNIFTFVHWIYSLLKS